MDQSEVEDAEFIIKAKGFPYGVTPTELAAFFAGCDIKGGKNKGLHFVHTQGKKNRTEAYLEMYDEDDVSKALQYNKKYIQDRYVEVIRSNREEMEIALEGSSTKGASGDTLVVKATGLPFTALPVDISEFFAGADIKGGKKEGIFFQRNDDGSPLGACFVEFITLEDVQLALSKDKRYLGNRFCNVVKSTADERDKAIEKQKAALEDISEPIVKLRGLPFKATESEIKGFFENQEIVSLEMVLNELKNCKGDAFIEFASLYDAKEALQRYKIRYLHRNVDVLKSSKSEWLASIPQSNKIVKTVDDIEEPIVKLNGLPTNVTKDQVEDFFFGMDCKTIQIVKQPKGNCNGEAFIQFDSVETVVKALKKNGEPLEQDSSSSSPVEVIASSLCDWRKTPLKKKEPSPNPRKRSLDHASSGRHQPQPRLVSYPDQKWDGGAGLSRSFSEKEFLVNMIGLPFSATEEEIRSFFSPLTVTKVQFILNDRGQSKGIAVVGFYTDTDRVEAMKRDKKTIGSRYINLYVRNEPRSFSYDFSKGAHATNKRFRSPSPDRYRSYRSYRHSERY